MADTYTSSLRLQQPTIGGDAATWGGYLNTDLVLIDNAINGVATINLAGLSSYTLTVGNGVVDQARNLVYNFTGALSGNCTVTVPQSVKFGYAINGTTGGHSVILTTGTGGTTLTLPTAAWYQFFYCDSSNVLSPSIGFGYANFLNAVSIGGNLSVTGTTTLSGVTTAGTVNAGAVNATGSLSCGPWFVNNTNGDQHIPYLANPTLSANLNQPVTTTSSPSFADVNLVGLGYLKASFINQALLTSSTVQFSNIYLGYLGDYLSNRLNQSVVTSSQPNFYNVYLGFFGDYLSNIINQRVRTVDSVTFAGVTVNGAMNASGSVSGSSATINGNIGAQTITLSASFSGSTSGWQLTPTGTGAFSGGFNLSINAAQGVLGNTFIAASDRRVKRDIVPITHTDAFRFVRMVGAKEYDHDGSLSAGFIAQDAVQHGFQRMVILSKSDDPRVAEGDEFSPAGQRLNLNYDCATAYHHSAIAALLQMVEELQDEVAFLKAARR